MANENENEGAHRSRTWTTTDRESLFEHIEDSMLFGPSDYTVTVSSEGGGYTVTETWRGPTPADISRFLSICSRGGNG